ncbi:MGMT family protein [Candidatus Berkiella cookevillensis]|uniref:MGMT family protein n=1 Tax=Candidatus Berkiella cookevillensis TaxID=437022 RepID=A0AAE3HNM8_9GAMM|nr:MGMT family protein [Candidatus Berkiella cookevillensis]
MNNPSAFQATARANGANQFAIIIPYHRVINIPAVLIFILIKFT